MLWYMLHSSKSKHIPLNKQKEHILMIWSMNKIIDKLSHKKVLKGLNCRNIDFTSKFSGDCVYFLINHIHWDNWCRSPTNIHKVNHSLYELNVYVISNKCSLLPEVLVPHCSPEKQFQSINTFAQLWFTIAMIKFWRRRILNSVKWMYFHYIIICSPWKRAWAFIWTNLNPLPIDGQTDGRNMIRKAYLRFQLRWSSLKPTKIATSISWTISNNTLQWISHFVYLIKWYFGKHTIKGLLIEMILLLFCCVIYLVTYMYQTLTRGCVTQASLTSLSSKRSLDCHIALSFV